MRKLITALVILGALAGLWGIGYAVYSSRDGYCSSVGPRPKEVFGRIRSLDHQMTYIFYYPGVYELSGKPCQYARWVGRVEYEHVMGVLEGE